MTPPTLTAALDEARENYDRCATALPSSLAQISDWRGTLPRSGIGGEPGDDVTADWVEVRHRDLQRTIHEAWRASNRLLDLLAGLQSARELTPEELRKQAAAENDNRPHCAPCWQEGKWVVRHSVHVDPAGTQTNVCRWHAEKADEWGELPTQEETRRHLDGRQVRRRGVSDFLAKTRRSVTAGVWE